MTVKLQGEVEAFFHDARDAAGEEDAGEDAEA
jgi:hypothetical protein